MNDERVHLFLLTGEFSTDMWSHTEGYRLVFGCLSPGSEGSNQSRGVHKRIAEGWFSDIEINNILTYHDILLLCLEQPKSSITHFSHQWNESSYHEKPPTITVGGPAPCQALAVDSRSFDSKASTVSHPDERSCWMFHQISICSIFKWLKLYKNHGGGGVIFSSEPWKNLGRFRTSTFAAATQAYELKLRKESFKKCTLCWMRDPWNNGLLQSLYTWVVCHPLYTLNNQGFFHCCGHLNPMVLPPCVTAPIMLFIAQMNPSFEKLASLVQEPMIPLPWYWRNLPLWTRGTDLSAPGGGEVFTDDLARTHDWSQNHTTLASSTFLEQQTTGISVKSE